MAQAVRQGHEGKTHGHLAIPGQSRSILLGYQPAGQIKKIVLVVERVDDGLKINLFGEETSLPVGAVRIAMRTGAAVVPAFNLRVKGNQYEVFFEPAIEINPDNGQENLEKNMFNLVQALEKMIKTCPEQWVVLSDIWAEGRDGSSPES